MEEEDDRYGPPTHTCDYCSRTFPATWEDKKGITYLQIDLLCKVPKAMLASESGCEFFAAMLSCELPGNLDLAQMKLTIDRNTSAAFWGLADPRLAGFTTRDGDTSHIDRRLETSVLAVYPGLGEGLLHLLRMMLVS